MKYFFTLLLIASFAILQAQSGTVNASFGDNGFVYNTGFGVNYAVAQQADGKIVTAGGYTDANFNGGGDVAQFLPDGTLDSTFGTYGYAFTFQASEAYDMLLQKDGKIVIVGGITLGDSNYAFVSRLQSNGNLDSTFGGNGIALLPAFGTNTDIYGNIRQETDGSFILAGYGITATSSTVAYSTICHLFADGTFDYSFGVGGRVINHTNITQVIYGKCLAIQADGRILLAGNDNTLDYSAEDYVLSRYNPDGSIDNSFGSGGTVITQGVAGANEHDAIHGLVVQPDGRIVLSGTSGGFNSIIYMAAIRYNSDGSLDNSFGTEGRALVSFGNVSPGSDVILLQPDGKIILAGDAGDSKEVYFATCRINTDGSLDSSFGIDGEQVTPFNESGANGAGYIDGAYCATLQSDGKIVQGGSYYNLAESFDNSLLVSYNNNLKEQNPLIAKIKRFLHNHGIGWQGLNANINYYSVQYSKTGSGFTEKGKVSGAGSSSFQQYNFAIADAGFYRVIAVDRKGYKTFSNKVAVSASDVTASASVFPNPASNSITVQGLPDNETANISIKDGSGKVLSQGVSNGSTQYRSSLANLQPGTYYMNITTTNKTETLKFVKE